MSYQPNTNYYMPYSSGTDSDLESDIESDIESDLSDTSEDIRIRQEQDPRYAILRKPTVSLTTSKEQTEYMNQNTQLGGAPWDESTNINSLEDHVYLLPPKTTKTSLISIKSTNRDRNVFPTPFNFQLKLPRVYKNVTKFQLVQLSFPNNSNGITKPNIYLSSFIQKMLNDGVPSTCIVSCINIINCTTATNGFGVIEHGRMSMSGEPLMTALSIRPGTYTDKQLANEITAQSNNTPPLNLISYEQFRDIFINTRDISVMFNEPGDNFFSQTNNVQLGQHTKEHIMNTYYTNRHIDMLPMITEQNAIIAYYFPVLKEALATNFAESFIQIPSDLKAQGVDYNAIYSTVMGPFEGFNSDLYYQICIANKDALDIYRRHLTFELRNVNKYNWSHSNNKFISIHDSLHTSITRDISKAMNNAINQEILAAGLTPTSFSTLKNDSIGYAAITKHLETNLSTCIGSYHLMGKYEYRGGDSHITSESTFTVSDLTGDEYFTTMFSYTSTFGRLYGNYAGIKMKFTNFADYHSTLSSYHAISQSTHAAIYKINSESVSNYHTYVSTKYTNILPQKMIDTRSYISNQGLAVSFVTNRAVYIPGHTMPLTPSMASMASMQSMPSMPKETMQPIQPIQPIQPNTQIPVPISSPPTNLIINPSVMAMSIADPNVDLTVDSTVDSTVDPNVDPTVDVSVDPSIDQTVDLTVDPNVDVSVDPTVDPFVDRPMFEPIIGAYRVSDKTFNGNCSQICCTYLNHIMTSWYSCLPTNLVIGSLTYRMGLINMNPATMNLISTVTQITSTGNLNFFMQINDEQGFNNLDVVMNEDYMVSNETTGQVKLMAAKILMGNVGDTGISQTLIQNPSIFEATLGKLDRLNFKIYYDDDNLTPAWLYLPFLLDVNEWNATFQVDEEIGFANQHSGWGNRPSIPVPANPNDTPYLGFTHRNNPNNA